MKLLSTFCVIACVVSLPACRRDVAVQPPEVVTVPVAVPAPAGAPGAPGPKGARVPRGKASDILVVIPAPASPQHR